MRRTGDSGPRMDQIQMNLNLSPPRARDGSEDSSRTSSSVMSSCVSSELDQEEASSASVATAAAEEEEVEVSAATTMMLAGCPRCLMYVMLAETETEPRCPRCKGSMLDLQEKTQSKRRD